MSFCEIKNELADTEGVAVAGAAAGARTAAALELELEEDELDELAPLAQAPPLPSPPAFATVCWACASYVATVLATYASSCVFCRYSARSLAV